MKKTTRAILKEVRARQKRARSAIFAVVVIGGMGSLPGTFLGGLILGVSQLVGAQLLGPGFQLLSGYLILLIVLTVRPQGLLGRR